MSVSCPPFWFYSPRILVSEASQFFPFAEAEQRCTAAALNSFTRFGLYLGIALALIRMEPLWLLLGVAFSLFAGGSWFYMSGRGSLREGFASIFNGGLTYDSSNRAAEGFASIFDPGMGGVPQVTDDIVGTSLVDELYVPDVIGNGSSSRTEPTAANPFMNVLISEISANPQRPPAANVQGVKIRSELDSYFDTMFAADPGDTFNRNQSQRQWVTMPSTTIPNDQESYQNWLYRVEGRTCKEGNIGACNFSTDNKMPWREIKPTT